MRLRKELTFERRFSSMSEKSHLLTNPELVKSTAQNGWYVKFYAFDSDIQEKRRIRIKVIGNTDAEKLKDAKAIIKEVIEAFQNGAYVSVMERKVAKKQEIKQLAKLTVESAIETYMNSVKASMKTRSGDTYQTWANGLLDFFKKQDWHQCFLDSVKREHIILFFDYLKEHKKLSNKSYNDYIGFVSGVFKFFIDRPSYGITHNPVVGFIKRKKVISGKHVPYTLEQARAILAYFKEHHELTYFFLQVCYYTLGRPREEIRNLKVSDIREDTIYFNPKNAKSTKTSYVVIPEPLNKLLKAYRIREYPQDYYLFPVNKYGKVEPGQTVSNSQYFYRKIVKALKDLGLKDKGYDLYSWKHTAVCQLFLSGVDIESIRQQCRHSDITQTIVYLKDLGMIHNHQVTTKFPEL